METVEPVDLVGKVSPLNGARPRVLFVGAFPKPGHDVFGGMVTSCRALLASSFPERVDLDLFDSTQATNPPPPFPLRLVRATTRFMRFVKRMATNKPRIVLLFVSSGASIVEKGAMAHYARCCGVPAVLFPRSGSVADACRSSARRRRWVKFWFGGATAIVCQSRTWQQCAVQQLGFAPEAVSVVRNWTATPELLKVGRQRDARASGPVRMLFVGWLERNKGVVDLLEACRDISANHAFTLDFIGDGTVAAEARDFVARHDLSDRIRFRGWLREDEVRRALQESDLFVLPSRAEGLPNSMVEAMAAGVPVIVTRVGAIPDFLVDRESALLVTPGDVGELAAALAELIESRGLRQALASAAYAIAQREFSAEAAAERLQAIIESTVTNHERRQIAT